MQKAQRYAWLLSCTFFLTLKHELRPTLNSEHHRAVTLVIFSTTPLTKIQGKYILLHITGGLKTFLVLSWHRFTYSDTILLISEWFHLIYLQGRHFEL